MRYEIVAQPGYAMVKVFLDIGETVYGEAGSMVAISGEVKIETQYKGIFKALTAQESIFINKFTAQSKEASVWLAPFVPGDIRYIEVKRGKGLILASSVYLAHHGEIERNVVWRGLKGMLGGGGLIWLKLTGEGGIWVNSCGAIIEKEVKPGEKFIMDNFHLVCMEDTLSYKIRKFGGLKSFLLGGEGLVFEVEGGGKIYLQTRNPSFYYRLSKR